jgi:type VI protein secretion system component Hcp
MRTILKLSAAMALLAGLAAAQDAITVNGNPLSCSTSVGNNSFPVLNWNFGATGTTQLVSGAGAAPKVSNLVLNRQLDACSVALFKAAITGAKLQQVTLTQTDSAGKLTLITLILQQAAILSYQLSGASDSPTPVESISIGFKTLQIQYGGPGGPTAVWNGE